MHQVFKVFLKLVDQLKCGKVSPEDTLQVSGYLKKSEYTVLPTVRNRWVSLHPSFGLVCWCDDEKLMKEFGSLDKIELLHFGELTDDEKEMISVKLPLLMHSLGIPTFSKVICLLATLSHGVLWKVVSRLGSELGKYSFQGLSSLFCTHMVLIM